MNTYAIGLSLDLVVQLFDGNYTARGKQQMNTCEEQRLTEVMRIKRGLLKKRVQFGSQRIAVIAGCGVTLTLNCTQKTAVGPFIGEIGECLNSCLSPHPLHQVMEIMVM